MKLCRLVGIASLSIVLGGCLQSNTLVRVKADGSGTIEQTLLMNLAALKGMLGAMGGDGQMKMGGQMNEADLRRAAERMGARFVSATPMKEGGFEGARAIFAFDDINKVRVDQDPAISGASSGSFSTPATAKSPISFRLARQGDTSTLTVTLDEGQATAAKSQADQRGGLDAVDPAMMAMMKAMFQGFRVAIDLDIDGTIVKTNADYVEGSRITLLDIDMGALLEDEAKLRALESKIGPGASIADVKPYLKDIQGVKINHSIVTVEYR